MGFDSLFGALLVWAILPAGILLLGVIVLAGGRGETDEQGQRGYSVYLSVTNFITLFVVLFASLAILTPVIEFILLDDEPAASGEFGFNSVGPGFDNEFGFGDNVDSFSSSVSSPPKDARRNTAISDVMKSILVLAPALALFIFHRRRRDELLATDEFEGSAAWRVDRASLYAICFSAVTIMIIAAASTGFDAFRSIAPGVTAGVFTDGSTERGRGLAGLITSGYLLAASVLIFRWHWKQVDPRPPETPAPEAPSHEEPAPEPG